MDDFLLELVETLVLGLGQEGDKRGELGASDVLLGLAEVLTQVHITLFEDGLHWEHFGEDLSIPELEKALHNSDYVSKVASQKFFGCLLN